MGNITVINANYDVKTAIARDMKNSLTRVSNDLGCEIPGVFTHHWQQIVRMIVLKIAEKE